MKTAKNDKRLQKLRENTKNYLKDKKRIEVHLTKEIYDNFKGKCIKIGSTVQVEIRKMIYNYIK